ncbi:MAG: hypothetical protein ACI8XV_002819, partial [Arenicella sp.]
VVPLVVVLIAVQEARNHTAQNTNKLILNMEHLNYGRINLPYAQR